MLARRSVRLAAALSVAALGTALFAGPARAAENPGTPGGPVDPTTESQNFSKTSERAAVYDTPQYQEKLTTVGTANNARAAEIGATDPARVFAANVCASGQNGCAGDVRLYDWATNGYGIVQPVLYTARNGATISGHVWATTSGPAKRPGVVITAGSVQADEQLYWMFAQALAKDGYVVLTTDPQGQGQSDIPGEGADQNEGVPAQAGQPFFDGTVDALNFFLSTPSAKYEPVASCSSGTSHAAKQDSRVASGLDTAYDPFWSMIDTSRVGLAGHSFGASGVSYVGQADPRVKTIVAWDNLVAPTPTTAGSCVDASQRRTVGITKPALGMSADYYLPPTPNTTVPQPLGKSAGSLAYTTAGVDTGELVIRGGSHFEFSFIPNQGFGASLRGADLATWYTLAWFDKYLKGDPTADARLLTNRWRTDGVAASVDPNTDPNDLSFYYRSRLAFHLADGTAYDCEDVRTGCAGLTTADGYAGGFDYLTYDTTPDGVAAVLPDATWPAALPLLAVAVAGGSVWAVRRRRSARL